jgi:hypothetical protein
MSRTKIVTGWKPRVTTARQLRSNAPASASLP